MSKLSPVVQLFWMILLAVAMWFSYHFADRYIKAMESQPVSAQTYVQPAPVYEPAPTYDIYQVTVEAFYAQPTPAPPTPVPPTPQSTKLTVCQNAAMYSTTTASQEYLIGYVGQGMVLDVAARSADMQWVKLLQGSATVEFWVPASAFCFE